jgi:hypothetical protein
MGNNAISSSESTWASGRLARRLPKVLFVGVALSDVLLRVDRGAGDSAGEFSRFRFITETQSHKDQQWFEPQPDANADDDNLNPPYYHTTHWRQNSLKLWN